MRLRGLLRSFAPLARTEKTLKEASWTFEEHPGEREEGKGHRGCPFQQVNAKRSKVPIGPERNERGEPSYSVWFLEDNQEPVLRIYLRKSDNEATNQPRHELFMGLLEKYGESLSLSG